MPKTTTPEIITADEEHALLRRLMPHARRWREERALDDDEIITLVRLASEGVAVGVLARAFDITQPEVIEIGRREGFRIGADLFKKKPKRTPPPEDEEVATPSEG